MTNNSAGKEERAKAINAALGLAIERGKMDMIQQAMDQGADAKILLDAGIKREDMDMIALALDKGAEPNRLLFAAVDRGVSKGETLSNIFHSIADDRPGPAKTSLCWAKAALDHGADPNAVRRGGDPGFDYPVLNWAHDHFKVNLDIIDLLIKRGARVDEPTPQGTPLMRAVVDGDAKAIEFFLQKGADPTFVCDKQKSFPLKALEDSEKFHAGKKAKLVSLMMAHLPATASGTPPAPAEGNATVEAIEISKPLELKRPEPPKQPKSFSI